MYQYITRRGPIAASILLLYWTTLFVATHWPVVATPFRVRHLDKVMHFSAYLVLAFLAAFVLKTPMWGRAKRMLAIFGLLAVYGALDELGQMLVPGRSADVLDWFADLAGAACGLLLFVAARQAAAALLPAKLKHWGEATTRNPSPSAPLQ